MAEDLAGAAAAWSSKASTSRPLIVLEEREADEKRDCEARREKPPFATAHVSVNPVVPGQKNSFTKLGEVVREPRRFLHTRFVRPVAGSFRS